MDQIIRTAVVVTMSVVLIGAVAPGAAAQPPSAGPRTDVIVRLTQGTNPDVEARTAERDGSRTKYIYRHVFPGFAAALPEQALEGLRRNPRVLSIEADSVMTTSATQSPVVWGLDRIDQRALPVDSSFTYPADGAGVTVYVIDTGISAGHVDFGGRVRSGYTAINDGRGTTDCNGHGTHVAGTTTGATYGVAKGTAPVAVRVLGCTGSGSTSGVIAGVDWATADHPAGVPAVANMSLGGPASSSLDAAVQALINDGVTVALAAGNNNGASACSYSPARVAAGLTVAASDTNDGRASFSNIGSCVDLFAPGVGITSAWHTSATATNTISGTSMAAPHVAGAAAVLLSQEPTLSPTTVASRLLGATTPGVITNAGTGSPNRLLYVDNAVGALPLSVANPGNQAGPVNAQTSLQMSASGGTPPYTWSVSGLPAGLSMDASTGLISGSPTTAGSSAVTVTATDAAGAAGTTSFTWTINAATACTGAGQKVLNPGFESGSSPWAATAGVIGQHGTRQPARSGTWAAWLGGNGTFGTETLSQSVTIPAGCTTYTLSFWLHVDTAETTTTVQRDRLTLTLGGTTLAVYSNLNRVGGYVQRTFDVASFAGRTVTLTFTSKENFTRQTSFVVDDTTITVS